MTDDRCGRPAFSVKKENIAVTLAKASKDRDILVSILRAMKIELKSLILAQIERWRHALHMQVERQRGLRPGGEWRTGE